MKFLYQCIIHFVQFLLPILKISGGKLKSFVEGRQGWADNLRRQISDNDKVIWFHAASLGEYEQAVPIINSLKTSHPHYKIAVSFFSPSGFEVKKKDSKLDVVSYLPLDTKKNASLFLDILKPELALIIKYEVWPNIMDMLHERKINSYLISGLFRQEQLYFKPLGKFMAKALHKFDHIFVQNEESLKLLQNHGFNHSSISGDTRYDRVIAQLGMDNQLAFMESFTASGELTIVFGSTWPEDISVCINVINNLPKNIKVVIAPHQIHSKQIQHLKKKLTKETLCYTQSKGKDLKNYQIIILDTIGLLTKVYSYANVAYVGGGMGLTGLHNVLEPAAFGIPVIIGKNYSKFPEAKMLRRLGGLFSIESKEEFNSVIKKMIDDKIFREKSGQICGHFVNSEAGASTVILEKITNQL